ncbi:class I SAM-dependent methyltransferase [Burkholderia multivorans]|nr:class I SAM-dependent methyltransferase [Burkholderia multivorans]
MISISSIHPDDDMYTGDVEHYESCGRQFADIIAHAVGKTDSRHPRMLELPCGYGRVTRHLVEKFAPEQIVVADIMEPCVAFCGSQFNVEAIQVVHPANEFRNIAEDAFDVAAMGSLVTHLSEENARITIENFLSKIRSGGIGVITTHGERSRESLEARTWFELLEEDRTKLLSAYDSRSHGFVQYAPSHSFERKTVEIIGASYGVSITHLDWMKKTIEELDFSIDEFIQGGWDNHQDVYFIRC